MLTLKSHCYSWVSCLSPQLLPQHYPPRRVMVNGVWSTVPVMHRLRMHDPQMRGSQVLSCWLPDTLLFLGPLQPYAGVPNLRRTGHSLIAVYFRSANNRKHMGSKLSQQRGYSAQLASVGTTPSSLGHSSLPVTAPDQPRRLGLLWSRASTSVDYQVPVPPHTKRYQDSKHWSQGSGIDHIHRLA